MNDFEIYKLSTSVKNINIDNDIYELCSEIYQYNNGLTEFDEFFESKYKFLEDVYFTLHTVFSISKDRIDYQTITFDCIGRISKQYNQDCTMVILARVLGIGLLRYNLEITRNEDKLRIHSQDIFEEEIKTGFENVSCPLIGDKS